MKIKDKKSSFRKAKELALLNWWLVWVAIIATSAYNYYTNEFLKDSFVKALRIMQKESNGIVMLDQLGRPLMVKKVPIDISSEPFQKVILNISGRYFINDVVSLTNNYSNTIPNVGSLEKYNSKFMDFRKIFIDKNDDNMNKKYVSFEKYIVYLINNDKLPEIVSTTNAKVTDYKVDGSSFKIKISYQLVASVYDTDSGTYKMKRGNIPLELEGVFDTSKGSIDNPLGLSFTDMKPKVLTKE